MKGSKLTHISSDGNPRMVDVSEKKITKRTAQAQSVVEIDEHIASLLKNDDIHTKKGPVFHTSIIAGVMAAKKTADLIPFCHPLPLDDCQITIQVKLHRIIILCTCTTTAKTGVEMEALTGASVAALTVYDMCKALSHEMTITATRLLRKTGGKTDYKRA